MKIKVSMAIILGMALFLSGCETIKIMLGTSIKHLEKARVDGVTMSFDCAFEECFDAVLSLATNEDMGDSMSGEKPFEVFKKDRVKSYIVVMGLQGNIDTTEAGVFFTTLEGQGTKIEVSSLSISAKEKVSKAVFRELNLRYNHINQ